MERPQAAGDLRHPLLAAQLRAGYQAIVEHVHARLAAAGFDDVRPAHMTVFQHLSPEGARIGEIAQRAHLTNQSVGYLVDYLENRGYVERRADPDDRRASLVCLTPRGWAEMRACAAILAELDGALRERLGAERMAQLDALLHDLLQALADRR